jgi:hypothetical protein
VLDGLSRRDRDEQRARVGVADVLARGDHDAAREEPRILAALEHRGEVVHRGVGVAPAHRLDERGREIVVAVARAVVPKGTLPCGVADVLDPERLACGTRRLPRELERLKRRPRVAARDRGELGGDLVGRLRPKLARAARHDLRELLERQRLELDHGAAGEKRLVDLEVRVLGRRADQCHEPVLDRMQH